MSRILEQPGSDPPFLAVAAHELMQPLAAALGSAVVLNTSSERLEDTDKKWLLQAVVRNLNQLQSLIDSLKVFGEIESGSLPLQRSPTKLRRLLQEIALDAEGRYSGRIIDFDCDDEIDIMVDAVLFRQVISNLLNNAKKYSPAGSRIDIRGYHEDGRVHVSIANLGEGFSSEDSERIFDKDVRLDPSVKGLGIGLYVSRTIVKAHGGQIWAESKEGKNAKFHVAIPA